MKKFTTNPGLRVLEAAGEIIMQNAKPTKTTNIHIAVQNFGPVGSADIDLRPFTVFVGQSNTGKTYLAALIYALHRTFHLPLEHGEQTDARDVRLRADFGDTDALEAELRRCFNIDSVSELIRFTEDAVCDEMEVTLKSCQDNQTRCVFQLLASQHGVVLESSVNLPLQWALSEAASLDKQSQAYFLPAVRRGLLEAHAPVKANGFSTDFLQQLVSKRKARHGTSDAMRGIADLLESEVLQGKIEVRYPVSEAHPEFIYRPQKGLRELWLRQASSQVSELAPLALFVRGVLRPGDLLIMEEPEAHLHPGAQAAIAVTLARLVRAGVRVIITTHSDWLLQQIGNLRLEGELEKLGEPYSQHGATLRREDIGAWLFQKHGDVEEIPFDIVGGIEPLEYGAIAEALYNHSVNLRSQLKKATGDYESDYE